MTKGTASNIVPACSGLVGRNDIPSLLAVLPKLPGLFLIAG